MSKMRNPNQAQVNGTAVNSSTETVAVYSKSNRFLSCQSKRDRTDSLFGRMLHFSRKGDNYTKGLQEHVKLGPKVLGILKGKLSLGARILRAGGVERAFRQLFTVGEGERLLKASQCYLSTSVGPIAGLLYISTEKVAFHSDRRIRLTSAEGEVVRIPYKVVIPLDKMKRVCSIIENMNKPKHKYIHINTVDDFQFWFMGFHSFQKTLACLQLTVL